jgi:cytochrome c oxidase cbb3-type subunit 4
MTYDTVATFSQVASLLLFVGLFIAVLAYVFWPRNRERFEAAAREALDLAPNKSIDRGQ